MKMLTKTVSIISVLALAGGLLAGCGSKETSQGAGEAPQDSGKKYTFRLADTHPADYPTVIGDKKFADLVNERTNGRIKIEVFPASQLGEEKAVVEQVQLGAIEFTRVSSGPLGEFNKNFGVFSLPYVFDSDEHLWKFLESEPGNKLLDSLESSKMRGLAYYSSGARHFYSRKPITSLADMKGQKVRVQQNKINIDLMAALGANATPMAYGEVFSSLQTGVIDAAENNFPSYQSSNHYEVAKNLILDGHQRVPEVLLISQSTWNKLSEEDRKIIKQAALDSVPTQREAWDKYEKEAEAKVRAAGVTITEVKDVKPWQDAVKPVLDKYRPEYKDVMDQIDAARK
ncbi:TRAP transporter substrate-binding protein [Paenibacillus xerothermodurans]|uniref:TRAP transporter substrate-binding protein n=1 Tax=Paenibacillus xerothermodurans TaxID=1977292 RepID=A0A2W1NJY4_PAEXE|nr:TRAP transporter substrate-binding protein [Paenibacillus xerothermodurans]PZE19785.1 TRAP transporter substrate-binding protein [Paenibacillus xerothermodurans]